MHAKRNASENVASAAKTTDNKLNRTMLKQQTRSVSFSMRDNVCGIQDERMQAREGRISPSAHSAFLCDAVLRRRQTRSFRRRTLHAVKPAVASGDPRDRTKGADSWTHHSSH